MQWKNYGDVNFLEHGGSYVRRSYDSETLTKHPLLSTCYDVFRLDNIADREDTVLCYMKNIDLSDFADESTVAAMTSFYGSLPDDPYMLAAYCAEYEGLQETVDRAFCGVMYPQDNDYILSRWEAAEWMKELGIPV